MKSEKNRLRMAEDRLQESHRVQNSCQMGTKQMIDLNGRRASARVGGLRVDLRQWTVDGVLRSAFNAAGAVFGRPSPVAAGRPILNGKVDGRWRMEDGGSRIGGPGGD
eukprot:5573371-Pyramimonas_sp.AAC.1